MKALKRLFKGKYAVGFLMSDGNRYLDSKVYDMLSRGYKVTNLSTSGERVVGKGINLKDLPKELVNKELKRQEKSVSTELLSLVSARTSKGLLSKAWYKVNDKIYLVKGNTEGGLEPFAEYVGSKVFQNLTNYAVNYDLVSAEMFPEVKTHDLQYVSVCEKLEIGNLMSFYTYLDYLGIDKGSKDFTIFEWLVKNAELSLRERVALMLASDAVIGNADRHFNNWDIEVETGKVAPYIDFGAGCLAWVPRKFYSKIIKTGGFEFDKSKPLSKTHKDQIRRVLAIHPVMYRNHPEDAVEQALSTTVKLAKIDRLYYDAVSSYLRTRAAYFGKLVR